jgi:hypothetical protein
MENEVKKYMNSYGLDKPGWHYSNLIKALECLAAKRILYSE